MHLMLSASAQAEHSLSVEVTSLLAQTSEKNSFNLSTENNIFGRQFISNINFMKHFHEFRDFEEKKFSLYTKKFGNILKTSNKTKLLNNLYTREVAVGDQSRSFGRITDAIQLVSLMAGDLRNLIDYLDLHDSDAKDSLTSGLDQVFTW